jgi:N6-L-threonylcarbamoyladenine synthase
MRFTTGEIVYNRSIHQDEKHRDFGGIVPNIASNAHLDAIKILKNDIPSDLLMKVACIAVTTGPGLIGSLLVGVSFAKGLAISLGVPLLRINHLEGHAVSAMIENENKLNFPYFLLLASGGNSQIILAKKLGDYEIIGETLDDATGEALDKIAKNLEIDYPGGVNLEKWAEKAKKYDKDGLPTFSFTDGSINKKTFNFSFSGLKTQVLYKIRDLGGIENISEETKADLAHWAQDAVFKTLTKKIDLVLTKFLLKDGIDVKNFVLCGGVSANKTLSSMILKITKKFNLELFVPSFGYTTDNACMIAKAGCMYWNEWKKNNITFNYNTMDVSFSPLAKWPIDCIKNNNNT